MDGRETEIGGSEFRKGEDIVVIVVITTEFCVASNYGL